MKHLRFFGAFLLACLVAMNAASARATESRAHCGTLDLLKQRAAGLRTASSRPTLSNEQTFDIAGFRIHYTMTGGDATNTDYLDALKATLQNIRNTELTGLGYPDPPSDGDGLFDIYLRELSGNSFFGYDQPETTPGDNPNTTQVENDSSTSYMVIDDDMVEPIYKSVNLAGQIKNMEVTVAHEFFHAIQFGLGNIGGSGPDTWLLESTAVYMEEIVFSSYNANYFEYLDDWFLHPDAGLIGDDSSLGLTDEPLHQYGSFIFWTFGVDHGAQLNEGMKELFFRYGSRAMGSISSATVTSEVSRLSTTWLNRSLGDWAAHFSVANAVQASPSGSLSAEISAFTHHDADSFLPLGGQDKNGGKLAIDRTVDFTGTTVTHDSISDANGKLGLYGADYLLLNNTAAATVTLTPPGGTTMSMSAVVGRGTNAQIVFASGTPATLTVNPGTNSLIVLSNLAGPSNPHYTVTFAAAPTMAPNCNVDRVGDASPDVGDAVKLLTVLTGGDGANCASGQCNFDGVLSATEPSSADLDALIAVILGGDASVCQ